MLYIDGGRGQKYGLEKYIWIEESAYIKAERISGALKAYSLFSGSKRVKLSELAKMSATYKEYWDNTAYMKTKEGGMLPEWPVRFFWALKALFLAELWVKVVNIVVGRASLKGVIESILEKRKIQKETDASTIKLRKDQVPSDIKVIIDCGFDDKMIDKEIVSLSSQLTRCYSDNRRCAYPIELYVTSFEGRLAERMRTVLKSQHISWRGIQFLDQSYDILYEKEGFRKEDFIYLTADSENTIYELDKSKIYIIGGLVDKNRYKNLCLDKAKSQGIYTAQLPIKDHIKMGSRKVLTVNQVLKIMHQWIEIKDWEKAFLNVIPSRKLPQSKTKNTDQQLEDLKTNSLILEDIGDLSEEAITEINE
ncbi:hypothetical protein MERGE_001270 [Pneumocystis wakefieldiae]|uniref:tRNA (guanine(9)-N1)-methyltransferase n=1 Tax=Pneumocystis wakefieldiae TaxID=38082 RepID=A0A899G289_9ASCO|nr:hypothetical protein MERGE_001270 [Pneumocystis wakefieldiae]